MNPRLDKTMLHVEAGQSSFTFLFGCLQTELVQIKIGGCSKSIRADLRARDKPSRGNNFERLRL